MGQDPSDIEKPGVPSTIDGPAATEAERPAPGEAGPGSSNVEAHLPTAAETPAPASAAAPAPSELSQPGSHEPERPSIADGVERRLDPRVIQLDRTVGWIVTAVVSFGLFIAGASTLIAASSWPGWALAGIAGIWFGVTALLAWWLQVWPAIDYRYASYVVDASGIEIRRGVVWRAVTNVPRSRVQHTDVSQGPLERRFGVGTLMIHTAGTDAAVVSLAGLTHETALAIRDHLLPREGPDAV